MQYDPETVRPFLTADQLSLYRLIWNRFVASQMAPAVFQLTTVDVAAGPYLNLKLRPEARAQAVLDAHEDIEGQGIVILLADDDSVQALNRDFRQKDYATNVLTFSYAESDEDPVAADIVLCCPVVEKEAKEQGKTLEAHFAHLMVHGVLHAHGYDHEVPAQAELMESIEIQTLTNLGYANPYAD